MFVVLLPVITVSQMQVTQKPSDMNAVYKDCYVSKKGTDTFIYEVQGTAEELAAYKEAKGEYYREDENGKPLFFYTNYVGERAKLIITTNGNVVPDRSALKKAMSIVRQAGGDAGQAMAAQAAQAVFGQLFNANAQAPAPTPSAGTPTPEPEQQPEDVENLEDLD